MLPQTEELQHEIIISESHQRSAIMDQELAAAMAMSAPSYLFRPKLSIDGNKWSALYGDNLQDGVAGFGDSPAEAYIDFDAAWSRKLPSVEDPGPKPKVLHCQCGRRIHGEPDFCPHCGEKGADYR